METFELGICGVTGRMGNRILSLVDRDETLVLTAAIASPSSPHQGQKVEEVLDTEASGPLIQDRLTGTCDALIDFSSQEGTRQMARDCEETGTPLVVGTTGLPEVIHEQLEEASRTIPVLVSANMAPGMNLLFRIASEVAAALGEEYDVEITEHHHRDKQDAPSGTALTLAEEISSALGYDPEKTLVHGRHGDTGPRPSTEIGMHAIRGGGEVGQHRVLLAGTEETVELGHTAQNRTVFARGAIRAARFVADASPGLYSMQDMLFGSE